MNRSLGLAFVLTITACDDPTVDSSKDPSLTNDGSTADGSKDPVIVVDPKDQPPPVLVVEGPSGPEECALVGDNLCIPASDDSGWCDSEDSDVDLIIVGGEVVDTVCYPTDVARVVTVDTTTSGDIEVGHCQSNTTVEFDPSLDGQVFHGDVIINANNVTLAGNGPAKTIIDGNVIVRGNKVRIRGVTITGNLTISRNSAVVLLTRVWGDVKVTKNNSLFVDAQVWGDFSVTGNNASLIGNGVGGKWLVSGQNPVCDDNYRFNDANSDHVVTKAERTGPAACD